MEKMEKMEIFQKNLEEASFTTDFIIQALHYFNELEEEKEANDFYNKVEEVIDDYNRCGSFTYNTTQSELNLKDFRGDISILNDYCPELLDINLYFKNIEAFEISILYVLYYNFYPEKDDEYKEDDEYDEDDEDDEDYDYNEDYEYEYEFYEDDEDDED